MNYPLGDNRVVSEDEKEARTRKRPSQSRIEEERIVGKGLPGKDAFRGV